MKIKYTVTEESVTPEGGERLTTYGITASESGIVLAHFNDVSLDHEFTEKIAYILNSFEVELCHFRDVIIDEINR